MASEKEHDKRCQGLSGLLGHPRPFSSSSLGELAGDFQETATEIRIKIRIEGYSSDDIKVLSNGNTLTVEAKHEERRDENNYEQKAFQRSYVLPENANFDQMKVAQSDGYLTITAPKNRQVSKGQQERRNG